MRNKNSFPSLTLQHSPAAIGRIISGLEAKWCVPHCVTTSHVESDQPGPWWLVAGYAVLVHHIPTMTLLPVKSHTTWYRGTPERPFIRRQAIWNQLNNWNNKINNDNISMKSFACNIDMLKQIYLFILLYLWVICIKIFVGAFYIASPWIYTCIR